MDGEVLNVSLLSDLLIDVGGWVPRKGIMLALVVYYASRPTILVSSRHQNARFSESRTVLD